MLWTNKIKEFEDNYVVKDKNYEYFYETNCYKNDKNTYKEKFVKTNLLPKIQDYTPFLEHIKKSKNKYVKSF